MRNSTYSASFTAGSLLWREFVALLSLLKNPQSQWLLKEEIEKNKCIKINAESSRKRVIAEIQKRYVTMGSGFWNFFVNRNEAEQKPLLFYVCLKAYKLLFDFHFHVTLPLWRSSNLVVDAYLYQMELNEIGGKDDFVYGWSDTTKQKCLSVYLKMIKDIDMLHPETFQLNKIYAANNFFQYFVSVREPWFLDACFLSEADKNQIIASAL
ncbi:hypothetical protein EZS27_022558 [termite gut metagenome]|uniref:Uncharacterized protein n=1 Tax=termite gut metagenome TaxID=433724 RepID=A0A5J4R3R8_9ZZZZ